VRERERGSNRTKEMEIVDTSRGAQKGAVETEVQEACVCVYIGLRTLVVRALDIR